MGGAQLGGQQSNGLAAQAGGGLWGRGAEGGALIIAAICHVGPGLRHVGGSESLPWQRGGWLDEVRCCCG